MTNACRLAVHNGCKSCHIGTQFIIKEQSYKNRVKKNFKIFFKNKQENEQIGRNTLVKWWEVE